MVAKMRNNEMKEVTCLEHKRANHRMFLACAAPKVCDLVLHNHVAQWQDSQYKLCLKQFKEGEIMSLIDSAENYLFKGYNEVQVEHWFSFQLTILIHIMYTLNPDCNPRDEHSHHLSTKYFNYISDNQKQDILFVQRCLNLHRAHLCAEKVYPKCHIIWSDGCDA